MLKYNLKISPSFIFVLHIIGTIQYGSTEDTSHNIFTTKVLTEVQTNGLIHKQIHVDSDVNTQQIINKSVNGIQNGITNGKAIHAKYNVYGDDHEVKLHNGASRTRPNEKLQELNIAESQKNGYKDIL